MDRELKALITGIAQENKKTAAAHRKTEKALASLIEEHKKTEAVVASLAKEHKKTEAAQQKTEAAQQKTEAAQQKTEAALLDLKKTVEKTGQQLGKLGHKVEKTGQQLGELGHKVENTGQQLAELGHTVENTNQQLGEQLGKLGHKVENTNQQLGGISHTMGDIAEDLFRRNLKSAFEARGIIIDKVIESVKAADAEFDLTAINGVYVILVEVKTKLRVSDIHTLLKRQIPAFRRSFPEYKKRKLIGALAALSVSQKLEKKVEESGLFLFTQTKEGGVSIANQPDFSPKLY